MKAWEASVFGASIPDGKTCRLCDKPMPNREEGRRWAQSFNFGPWWICGDCSDELYGMLTEP